MAQITLNSTGVASSGALSLQSNGTTEAIGISTGQVATLAQNPILTSGTSNGVAYLNGSKIVTTGSALTFDGSNFAVTGGLITGTKGSSNGLTIGDVSTNSNALLRLQGTSAGYNFLLANNLNVGGFEITPSTATGGTTYSNPVYSVTGLGLHKWFNGTTQAMTLDASGRLLVANTSSTGTNAKLVVGSGLAASNGLIVANTSNGTYAGLMVSNWTGSTTTNGPYISFDNSGVGGFSIGAGNGVNTFDICTTWGTPLVRVDSSGNLGVGMTSPSSSGVDTGVQRLVAQAPNSNTGAAILAIADSVGRTIRISDQTKTYIGAIDVNSSGVSVGSSSSIPLLFATGGTTQARIDSSGNLLVGTTSMPSASVGGTAFRVESADRRVLRLASTNTGAGYELIQFWNPNGQVGRIETSGSATAYVTSSDYRLKENIAPMTGALATVAQLKPCTYTWKADGSVGQGFIAHELQSVVPDAVSGEKDAIDEEGNPKYQGIDTSFLVATLTAAIKEQQAIIESLTARITALEA